MNLKKDKILLLSATELEHGVKSICDIPVHITGVGKISAAYSATKLINQYNPELVINFGSCGNLKNHKIGELIRIGKVHNDIDTQPFSKYGETPFSDWGVIEFDDSEYSCFSTDYFYDASQQKYSADYMNMVKMCDVIDMELYSIAQVCLSMGISIQSFKWISDDGSSNDWESNASSGFEKFEQYIKSYING